MSFVPPNGDHSQLPLQLPSKKLNIRSASWTKGTSQPKKPTPPRPDRDKDKSPSAAHNAYSPLAKIQAIKKDEAPERVTPAQSKVNELPPAKRKSALSVSRRVGMQLEGLVLETNKLAGLKRSKQLPSVRGAVLVPAVKKDMIHDLGKRKDNLDKESLWPDRHSPIRFQLGQDHLHGAQKHNSLPEYKRSNTLPSTETSFPRHPPNDSSTSSPISPSVTTPSLRNERTWPLGQEVPLSPAPLEPRSPYASSFDLRELRSERKWPGEKRLLSSPLRCSFERASEVPTFDIEPVKRPAPARVHPALRSRTNTLSSTRSSSETHSGLDNRESTSSTPPSSLSAINHGSEGSWPRRRHGLPRRPTLIGAFSSPVVPKHKDRCGSKPHILSNSPDRCYTHASTTLESTVSLKPPVPQTPGEPSTIIDRQHKLADVSSSPIVPITTGPGEASLMPTKYACQRPLPNKIVTTRHIPLARCEGNPGSPRTPDIASFPRMHQRPTIADIVQKMEQENRQGLEEEALPSPPPIGEPGLRRVRSYDSDVSSLMNGTPNGQFTLIIVDADDPLAYSEPSSPGNAFGSYGFWARTGKNFEAKPEDVHRWERGTRKRDSDDSEYWLDTILSSDSDESDEKDVSSGQNLTKKRAIEGYHKSHSTSSLPTTDIASKRAYRGTGSQGANSCSSPGSMKPLAFETPDARDGSLVRSSMDSDPPSAERPFSTVDFLKTLGVKQRKSVDEEHPFPEFELPEDPVGIQAYGEVRDTLIAYWSSKKYSKDNVTNFEDPIADTPSHVSKSQAPSRGPSNERPSLNKKPSRFRLFSRTSSATSVNSASSVDSSEIATHISAKPGTLMSNKESQDLPPSLQFPAMDKQPHDILSITRAVLVQMQAEFGRMRYPTFEHYVAIKPPRMAADISKFDEEEDRVVENYTIKSFDQLVNMESWRFYKDPKAANDDRYLQWSSKHEFETVVDRQRQALYMNNVRRKNTEMRVPAAGHRMIWATKFADWAVSNLEKATEEWENNIARAIEKKGVNEFTQNALNISDDESDGSDDLDDDLVYPKILQEIRRSANKPSKSESESEPPVNRCQVPDFPVPSTHFSYESFVADLTPDCSSPTSPTFSDESPEEARKRRRRTAFNMGLINAEQLTEEPLVATREVNTPENDRVNWEEELKAGLAKEKDRQKRERWVMSANLEEVAEADEEGC